MIWYVASWKPVLFADTSADLEGSFKKLKQTKGKVEGQMKKLEKKVKDGMKSIQSLPFKMFFIISCEYTVPHRAEVL